MKKGMKKIGIGLLLMAATVVLPIAVITPVLMPELTGENEIVMRAPGEASLVASEAGRYFLWYNYRTVHDGRVYALGSELPHGLEFTLTGQDTNSSVPLVGKTGTTFSINGRDKTSVGYFEVIQPGTYTLRVQGDMEARIFSLDTAPEHSVFGRGFLYFCGTVIGGLLALACGIAGFVLVISGVVEAFAATRTDSAGSKPAGRLQRAVPPEQQLPCEHTTLHLMLCSVAAGAMMLNCLRAMQPTTSFLAYAGEELWLIGAWLLTLGGTWAYRNMQRRLQPHAAQRHSKGRLLDAWCAAFIAISGMLFLAGVLLATDAASLMLQAAVYCAVISQISAIGHWRAAAERIRQREKEEPTDGRESAARRNERIALLRRLTLWAAGSLVVHGAILVALLHRHYETVGRAAEQGTGLRNVTVDAAVFLAAAFVLLLTAQYRHGRRALPVPDWHRAPLWLGIAGTVLLFGFGYPQSLLFMSLAVVILIALWLLCLVQLWSISPVLVDTVMAMRAPAVPESAPPAAESAPAAAAVDSARQQWRRFALTLAVIVVLGGFAFGNSPAESDSNEFMVPGAVIVSKTIAGGDGTLTPVADAVYAGKVYSGQGDFPAGMVVTATERYVGTGLAITGSSGRQERGRYVLRGDDEFVRIHFPKEGEYQVSVAGGARQRVLALRGAGISFAAESDSSNPFALQFSYSSAPIRFGSSSDTPERIP